MLRRGESNCAGTNGDRDTNPARIHDWRIVGLQEAMNDPNASPPEEFASQEERDNGSSAKAHEVTWNVSR
jgi:hypothetical protein